MRIFDRIEKPPGDLLAAVVLAALTLIFTLVEPLASLPVRIPLGLAIILFLPGYTLITALFPRKDNLDGIERLALAAHLPGKDLDCRAQARYSRLRLSPVTPERNWTYPHVYYPVYPRNRTISDTLFETDNLKAVGRAVPRLNAPSF